MIVQFPQVFEDLFKPARYKVYYGGRGGGKSWAVAGALVLMGAQKPLRILCTREIMKSIKDSVKRLADDRIKAFGLSGFYTSTETEIRAKNGTLFIFAGLRNNPEAVKSTEGVDIAWIEEASTVSQRSLDLLIPTVRKEGSELIFTYNPDSELDAVDILFRGKVPPPNSIIKKVSWSDNPFFTDVLKQEMEFMKETNYEKYQHVYEGGYNLIQEGAYYAKQITTAISENRITKVQYDPSAPVYVAFDLGISDLTSMWFVQFVGLEVHVIDFLESNGQPIDWYVQEMQKRGYVYGQLILPHDARARSLGTGKTIEEVLRGFGYEVVICPNISVKDGIDAARTFLNKCWFDQEKCDAGLKHLQNYRENYDEKLRVSRGALHDEHSHAADAWRYLCVGVQDPKLFAKKQQMVVDAAQNYVIKLQSNLRPDPRFATNKEAVIADYVRRNLAKRTQGF